MVLALRTASEIVVGSQGAPVRDGVSGLLASKPPVAPPTVLVMLLALLVSSTSSTSSWASTPEAEGSPSASPAIQCDALRAEVAHLQTQVAMGLLPPGALATPIAKLPRSLGERLADELGRGIGTTGSPLDAQKLVVQQLVRATAIICPVVQVSPLVDVVEAAALKEADSRFAGVRADRDAFSRFRDAFFTWLENLLQNETMISASESIRTIFLGLFAPICAFLAFRVWRRERSALAGRAAGDPVNTERRRRRAFQELRALARDARDRDPRGSAVLLRAALLCRVGEVSVEAARAVRPSRTTPEILTTLPAPSAAAVGPALRHFDDGYYGGLFAKDHLAAFEIMVDAAAAALDGAPSKPGTLPSPVESPHAAADEVAP